MCLDCSTFRPHFLSLFRRLRRPVLRVTFGQRGSSDCRPAKGPCARRKGSGVVVSATASHKTTKIEGDSVNRVQSVLDLTSGLKPSGGRTLTVLPNAVCAGFFSIISLINVSLYCLIRGGVVPYFLERVYIYFYPFFIFSTCG